MRPEPTPRTAAPLAAAALGATPTPATAPDDPPTDPAPVDPAGHAEADRRLRESEARYRALLEASPDIVFTVDADGRFTYLSGSLERLLGRRPEDVVGQHFGAIMDAGSMAAAGERWTELRARPGVVMSARFDLVHRDERRIPFEVRSSGLVIDGVFVGVAGAARDVSERDRLERELRASEARYRYLVDDSPDIVWSADAEGRFTYMSDTSERMLGWRPEELVGRHFSIVVHQESLDLVSSEYAASVDGAAAHELRYRFVGIHRDGSRVPLEMHARTIVEDGRYLGAHGAVRDLRDRERLERDLRRQAAALAANEERAHLARELHDSVTQALFSMTLVTRSIEVLLERDAAAARTKLSTLRDLQRDALAEMRALIFELRPASLEADGLLAALRTHTAAVRARTGLPVTLDADDLDRMPAEIESALFRIAQEGLNNIVKHASPARVTVRTERKGSGVRLTIEDDGAGFDPSAVPAGHLGIAGMRARAEKLGGRLFVESAPGRGTRVTAEVPVPGEGSTAGHDAAGASVRQREAGR